MEILIKLKNNTEILTDLSQEEYEGLKKILIGSKVKRIEIEDKIIDINMISLIEPIGQESISKKFRLSEPKLKKVGKSDKWKKTWNTLKSKELFQNFNSYEEFRKAKNY